jgi:DNA-binding FrmR family transcriptional regulator
MSHTSREKLDLVNRTKRVFGQLESALRGLNEDEHRADVLQRLAATSTTTCPGIPAAEDVIEIVRSYLK